MIIAQLSISPVGESTSLSKYVKLAIETLKSENIKFETNAMATVIETDDLNKLFIGETPYDNVPRQLVWRNEGEELQILNLNTLMDSVAIATRDTIYWPNVTEWADNLTPEYINLVAEYFEPNSKELLPIHNNIIDANINLQNDYGY